MAKKKVWKQRYEDALRKYERLHQIAVNAQAAAETKRIEAGEWRQRFESTYLTDVFQADTEAAFERGRQYERNFVGDSLRKMETAVNKVLQEFEVKINPEHTCVIPEGYTRCIWRGCSEPPATSA